MSALEDSSGVAMTIKDMVTEVYNDMKVVRPIAESLDKANLPFRVHALEDTQAVLHALGPQTLAALTMTTDRVNTMWGERQVRQVRNKDLWGIVGNGKSFLLMLAAVASPVVAIAVIIHH